LQLGSRETSAHCGESPPLLQEDSRAWAWIRLGNFWGTPYILTLSGWSPPSRQGKGDGTCFEGKRVARILKKRQEQIQASLPSSEGVTSTVQG